MFGACASFAALRVYTCESDSTLTAVQCMTSSMDHSSKLKAHMVDIMAVLIEESDECPQVSHKSASVELLDVQLHPEHD